MQEKPISALTPIHDSIDEDLDALRSGGLWRECAELESPPGPHIRVAGTDYLHLCSNNYLDLANHPEVIDAARQAALHWGTGTGAARLITGTLGVHADLERDLAKFKRAEAALVFSSGYLANIGLVQALARPGDWLLCDELNHASLIDAARLSRAEIHVYPHADASAAANLIRRAPASARKIILTDGVFSMDGDVAPLRELAHLATEHGAWLAVDEAHGTGVFGPGGRGACAEACIEGDFLIQIVTLSKALGSQGGAVVGSRRIIDLVLNRARAFIFDTALAPPAVAAARAALKIIQNEGDRRSALDRNIGILRRRFSQLGLAISPAPTPIFPLLLGSNARALEVQKALRELGYWISAIRPPTVPEGTSRLRITLMSGHTPEEIERFADDLGGVL